MINIVLPVDFSDKTDLLVDGAIEFAKKVNGKIKPHPRCSYRYRLCYRRYGLPIFPRD